MEAKRDERNAVPCKYCLKKHKVISYPEIVVTDSMYYARCPNCNSCDKYDFLALSEKKAIRVWNDYMEGKGYGADE